MKKIAVIICFVLISLVSHATMYEDAEDGTVDGWSVYDNTPLGASFVNIFDANRQSNVIELNGDGWRNGYILGATPWYGGIAWNNTNETAIQWSMNYNEHYAVYVSVQTTKGHRYLYYTSRDSDGGLSSNGHYIHHGLGSSTINGTWQTFTRDLKKDLKEFESDNKLISVNAFLIRGNGKVDDIELLPMTGEIVSKTIDNKLSTYIVSDDINKYNIYQIYIDTDNNKNTGYSRAEDAIFGAEYLIEQNRLYKSLANGHVWSWEELPNGGWIDNNSFGRDVALSTLPNLNSIIKVAAFALNDDWTVAHSFHGAAMQEFMLDGVDIHSVGRDQLNITLKKLEHGMEITGIKNGAEELLHRESELFSLNVKRVDGETTTEVFSSNAWSNIEVINNGNDAQFVFSQPTDANLPDSLMATATLKVAGAQSQWDLSVSGLGNYHSLMGAKVPHLLLKSNVNDHFFVPKYSGQLIHNPLANKIDRTMLYPRGWSTSMQFLAQYNNNNGVYLGFHDSNASTKNFIVKAENGALKFYGDIIIPNKTRSANDWELPGVFELDVFEGNWYDAAMIYKQWASEQAEYWPEMTKARIERQNKLGRIAVWGTFMEHGSTSLAAIEAEINEYTNYFGSIPVGLHWYQWNEVAFDSQYPDYFPERTGMNALIGRVQESGDAYIMPYINGRLYDTALSSYKTKGHLDATKSSADNVIVQKFKSNDYNDTNGIWREGTWHTFAVMDPTQKSWQDRLIDASKQLTNRIGSSGIYLDQVAASRPTECMDPDHGHPLGGGHWWRDGYNEMLTKIHANIPPGKFVTVEGGNDYLANQVDGFLTGGWRSDNLVPAFQAVYSGRVQLIGKDTNASQYNSDLFYAKISQAFVTGVQLGRTSLYFVRDPNAANTAAPFVKQLATMRYKLKEFLSFGSLLKPQNIHSNVPKYITSTWKDYGEEVNVTISAIQSSIYTNRDNSAVAMIFVNASMHESIEFSFDFDGSLYGLSGLVEVEQVTDEANETLQTFPQAVTLEPLKAVAFIITQKQ